MKLFLTKLICGLLFSLSSSGAFAATLATPVTDQELACQIVADCVLVRVACSCDYGLFVGKEFESPVERRAEELCKEYSGPVCKMRAAFLWPTCEKKKCVTHTAFSEQCHKIKNVKTRKECQRVVGD